MNLGSAVFLVLMVNCTGEKRRNDDNDEPFKRYKYNALIVDPGNRVYQDMIQKLKEFIELQTKFNQRMLAGGVPSQLGYPNQSLQQFGGSMYESLPTDIPVSQQQSLNGYQFQDIPQQQFNRAPPTFQNIAYEGTPVISTYPYQLIGMPYTYQPMNNPANPTFSGQRMPATCTGQFISNGVHFDHPTSNPEYSQRVIDLTSPPSNEQAANTVSNTANNNVQPSTSRASNNSTLRFQNYEDLDNYFDHFNNLVSLIKSKEVFFKFLDECALDEINLKKRVGLNINYLGVVKLGPALREYFYEKLIGSEDEIKNEPVIEDSDSEINTDVLGAASQSTTASEKKSHSMFEITNLVDSSEDEGRLVICEESTSERGFTITDSDRTKNVLKELGATEEEINQFVSLKDSALKHRNPQDTTSHIEKLFDPVIFYLIRDAIIKLKYDLIYRKYFICELKKATDAPDAMEGIMCLVNSVLSDFETLQTHKEILEKFFDSENRLYIRTNLYSQIKLHFDMCVRRSTFSDLDEHLVDTVNNLMRLRYTIIQGMCYHLMRIFDVGSPTKKSLYKNGDLPFLLLCTFLDFKKVEEYTLSD